MSRLSDLLKEAGGSTTAFTKNAPVGSQYQGIVLSVNVRGSVDPATGKPETWDDGNAKEQVVVTIQTAERDPAVEDDDGSRSIYIKFWGVQKQALVQALRDAKAEDIEIGGTFAAALVGHGPQPDNKALSPAKLFKYQYKAPSPTAGLFGKEIAAGAAAQQQTVHPDPNIADALAVQAAAAAKNQQPWLNPTPANVGDAGAAQRAAFAAQQAASTPAAPPAEDIVALMAQVKSLAAAGLAVGVIATATNRDPSLIAALLAA